jgi:quercetin dioxygenase-like cupin family protein
MKAGIIMNRFMHIPAGEKRAYWVHGSLFRFLVSGEETGGSCSVMEILVSPGNGAAPHSHPEANLQYYVLEGTLTFLIGHRTIQVGPGDLLYVPRGTLHAVQNGDSSARMIASFSPAGPEKELLAQGRSMEARVEA